MYSYSEHINNIYKSIRQKTQQKARQRPLRKINKCGQYICKKVLNLVNSQGNRNYNHNEAQFYTYLVVSNQKIWQHQVLERKWINKRSGDTRLLQLLWENNLAICYDEYSHTSSPPNSCISRSVILILGEYLAMYGDIFGCLNWKALLASSG